MSARRVPLELYGHPAPYVGGFYRGVVDHVVDGDTLDVLLDLGCQHYVYQSVRLAGINAPEIATVQGKLSANETRVRAEGKHCLVRTVKDREKFGRYLALVYLQSSAELWTLLNLTLVSTGYAVRYMDDGIDLAAEQDVSRYLNMASHG